MCQVFIMPDVLDGGSTKFHFEIDISDNKIEDGSGAAELIAQKVTVWNKVGLQIIGIPAASFKEKEVDEDEVAAFFKAMNTQRVFKMNIIFKDEGEAELTAVAIFAE